MIRELALALMAASLAPVAVRAQGPRVEEPATGRILVASRDLLDPNFVHAVVLLVHMDDDGVVGLILNRRTNIPLSRLFDKTKDTKGGSDPLFSGGPVGRTGVLALLRSRSRPEGAEKVLSDVALISDKALLEKTLTAGTAPGDFRAYLGYSGWAPDQLDNEIEAGAWFVFPANASVVFDANPEEMWTKMIQRTERGIARGKWSPPAVHSLGAKHRQALGGLLAGDPAGVFPNLTFQQTDGVAIADLRED